MRLFADRPSQADGSRARIASAILNWERSLAHWKRVLTVIFSALLTVIAVVCLGVGLNIVGLGRDTQAIPPAPVTEVEAPQLPVPLTDDAIKAAGLHEATPTVSVSQMTATALDNLSAVDGSSALDTVAISLSSDQREQIEQNLQAFADAGAQVSFAVADLGSGGVIAANGGVARYPASSIKAPYIVSLAQTGAVDINAVATSATADAAGLNQLITQTLQVSDNDTYEALYKRFGAAPTMQWLAGTGATTGLNGYYGDVTAIDLARMWVNSYDYLFGASADAADAQGRTWLAQQMRSSLNSSIAAVHGEGEIVASKAGWIYGEGNLYAYNDAGIVIPAGSMQLSEKPQGYVLAMLTNACARDDLLTALAQTVDDAMRAA